MAHCYGGYTTNVPLEDLLDGKAWIAFEFDGETARPRARRPGAAARAAPLLLEEREVGARARHDGRRRARILGAERLPHLRRPVARGALLVSRADMASAPGSWVSVAETRDAHEVRAPHHARRARLAGQRRRAAPRRAAHRPGRLPGDPLLLDRVGRRPATGSSSPSTTPGRRGVAVPRPRRAGGRPARGARAARRLLRLAPATRPGAGAADRRRLGHRAAAARWSGRTTRRRQHRAVPAAVLGAHAGGRVLPRTSSLSGAAVRTRVTCVYTREAPAGWPTRARPAHARQTSPTATSRRTDDPASSSAARPDSSRRSPDCSSTSGHDPQRVKTERFGGT